MRQRGFTLIEVTIVAAIAAAMLAAAVAFSQSQHARSLRASVQAFDGLIHNAQAVAATSGNGATVVVASRGPAGSRLYLYAGRPNAPQTMAAQGPPLDIDAVGVEATLGTSPFALFFNGARHVSGLAGYPDLSTGAPSFSPVSAEPACPTAGRYTVTLTVGQTADVRTFACSVAAATSTDAIGTPPPPP